mmetsp:Transcript_89978/g.159280  ORF Transcript_89978/g.159280 Transcript_89978/m.159280 type:complete len:1101 (+) Transcript_89978:50-3352(+)
MLRARGGKDAEDTADDDQDYEDLPYHKDSPKKGRPPKGENFVKIFIACFVGVSFMTAFHFFFIAGRSNPDDLPASESVMETPEDVKDVLVRGENVPLREMVVEDVIEQNMNGIYKEHPQQMVNRHETYWSEDGAYFVYYCSNHKFDDLYGRWGVAAGDEIGSIEAGHCASSVRGMQVTDVAEEVQNWEERDGDIWLRRGIAETNFRVVSMVNLGSPDANGDYVERHEMILQRRETYWHDNGKYLIYKCFRKDTDLYNRWVLTPLYTYEQVTTDCFGHARAPVGRDILDPATLKGWENAFGVEWEYLEDGGVSSLGWRKQSDNPIHKAFNLVPPPASSVVQGLDCHWCRHSIHGVFPSTDPLPSPNVCVWTFFPQRTIGTGELDDTEMMLERAKSKCINLGHMCTGVVCHHGERHCSVRGGTRMEETTDSFMHSYLPVCAPKEVGNGVCNNMEAPEAELAKPDFGDNEELSGAALLVFSHGQPQQLKTCMASLVGLNGIGMFDIYISLDPFHQQTLPQISEIAEKTKGIQAQMLPDLELKATHHLNETTERARWIQDGHYRYQTFEHIFKERKYKYAIFVEEFQVFAPDFLALFRSAAWLLRSDATVWCVSAMNDIALRAQNECRLLQSSTFNGEGFLFSARVWNYLRQAWPKHLPAVWTRWMDITFHRDSKVCIIPEVPRIRHSQPITLYERAHAEFAFSKKESTCQPQGPCNHFGDISYLIEKHYTQTMHAAAKQLPILHLTPDGSIEGGIEGLKADQEYLLPMTLEEYTLDFAKMVGHWPNTELYDSAWHETMMGDRHGIMDGQLEGFTARTLIVDRRSAHHYLAKSLRVRADKHIQMYASLEGESCTEACVRQGTYNCIWDQMVYYNTCRSMERVFGCNDGCLPTYDLRQPGLDQRKNSTTEKACLVPHNLELNDRCETMMPGMLRLCPCYVEPETSSTEETAYDQAKWMPKYVIDINRKIKGYEAENSKQYIWKSKMAAPAEQANMKASTDMRRYKKTHDPRDNPRRLDFVVWYNTWMDADILHDPSIHDVDYSIDEAFNACEKIGYNYCRGFTCDRDEKACRLRTGKTHPSKKGEVTYQKSFFHNNGQMEIYPNA